MVVGGWCTAGGARSPVIFQTKAFVVDPRRNARSRTAPTLYRPIKPGTDLALLNGILHQLVVCGRIHEELAEHTHGWAMPEFLADYTPETTARITGLSGRASAPPPVSARPATE